MFDAPLPEITDRLTRAMPPLPPIFEPATRTEVATAAAAALDLKKIDLTDVALAQFGDWRAALADAEKRLAGIAWDVSTDKGLRDIKSVRNRETKVPRAEANKIADALASKLTQVAKDVRAEQGLIVAAWDNLAEPLTAIIDAREAELAEEARKEAEAKAERERLEREAAEKHAARRSAIAMYALRCQEPGMTAERIAAGMQRLEAADLSDADNARAVDLADLRCRTLESMRTLHAQAVAREAEAHRQEQIRAENERMAAELAEARRRIDAEAAEIRRQTEELAAQRAESERLERLAVERREAQAAMTYPNGAPMFGQHIKENGDRIMLDPDGKRSVFCDVDEGDPIRPDDPDAAPAATDAEMGTEKPDAGMMLQDECETRIHTAAAQARQAEAELLTMNPPAGEIIGSTTDPAEIERSLADEPAADDPAEVTMSALANQLGFRLTEEFVRDRLGVHPAKRDGRAVLFTQSQRRQILGALARHVQALI